VTGVVLPVLFQQCVHSIRSIHRTRAHRPSNQIQGATNRKGRRFPNSQRRRSTDRNGPNIIRDVPVGRGGERKLGWVYFEKRLGHVRIINLISSLPGPKSFHYSTFREYDGRWFTRKGYIRAYDALPTERNNSVFIGSCLRRGSRR